jgi:hypothetical protein
MTTTARRPSRPSPPPRRTRRGVSGAAAAGVILLELMLALAVFWFWRAREPALPAWTFDKMPRPFAYRADVGRPISDSVVGLTMFRGNATRTWYGKGPVPRHPEILWRYPGHRPMCAISFVGRQGPLWCGSGWTGQPSVVERGDGDEVIVGTYDRAIHFLDGATGRQRRPPFATGDIIKGSVAIDPDGYPLVYSGSRDNFFHVIAIDRPHPTELWRLSAADAPRPMWNDDWDGNAVVVDDYLFEGGENGWFYVVKLNRRTGSCRWLPKSWRAFPRSTTACWPSSRIAKSASRIRPRCTAGAPISPTAAARCGAWT